MEESQKKPPRFQKPMKKSGPPKEKKSGITPMEKEPEYADQKCPMCSKFFLRKGSLARHLGCKTCKRSAKPREKHEQIENALKAQAMGIATTCTYNSKLEKSQRINKEDQPIDIWGNKVKGSARKGVGQKRKKGKFTTNQKQIMEQCFDKGECNKKRRHTTSSCKKLMLEKLGQPLVLTENQIASY